MFYRNFELIFEFTALKRAPICGRNVYFSFFLRIFTSNSDIFNQIKKDETDPMPKYQEINKNSCEIFSKIY